MEDLFSGITTLGELRQLKASFTEHYDQCEKRLKKRLKRVQPTLLLSPSEEAVEEVEVPFCTLEDCPLSDLIRDCEIEDFCKCVKFRGDPSHFKEFHPEVFRITRGLLKVRISVCEETECPSIEKFRKICAPIVLYAQGWECYEFCNLGSIIEEEYQHLVQEHGLSEIFPKRKNKPRKKMWRLTV